MDIEVKINLGFCPGHTLPSNDTVRRSLNTFVPLFFSYTITIMTKLLATPGCKKIN